MDSFSTPIPIKLSFYLYYFVIAVLYYVNRYLLLFLVVNLLLHLLSTFYIIVGSLNITFSLVYLEIGLKLSK